MSLILCARLDNLDTWLRELRSAMPDETIAVWSNVMQPADVANVNIALVAKPPPGALARFPNLRLIASLWAGVDGLLADPTLPAHVPLTRLIDPQLTAAMVESVVMHVLSAHRMAPRYRSQQTRAEWIQHEQPAAAERAVVILGFGELGRECAEALLPFGFPIIGWARTSRSHPRIRVLHDDEGLREALGRACILVCLLPVTAQTRRLLDAEHLSLLPQGATLINVGRGA